MKEKENISMKKKVCCCLKRQNLYGTVDVMAFTTLLLFVLAVVKKDISFVFYSFLSGVITCLTGAFQVCSGETVIMNKSGKTIKAKPEEGCDPVEIEHMNKLYGSDGIKVDNTVYKIGDGCHAVVREDGTVKVKSLTGKVLNYINGGGVLTEPPAVDKECWQKLFDC